MISFDEVNTFENKHALYGYSLKGVKPNRTKF